MGSTLKWLLAVAAIVFLGGCAAPPLGHDPQTIREHVITVDGMGRPHDPNDPSGNAMSIGEYRDQIALIFKAMDAYHKMHPGKKILIFVHGGLNSPQESLQNADEEMDSVMAAGYYPIYLDWNSDFLSTYGDHIATITQGQTDSTIVRASLAPVYVGADLGRAATRMPIVWLNQLTGDIQSVGADINALPRGKRLASTTQQSENAAIQRWAAGQHGKALVAVYQQLLAAQAEDEANHTHKAMRIFIGPDFDVDPWDLTKLWGMYVLTVPTKIVSEPIIDWLGSPAWEVMYRRTLIAFDGDLGGNPANPDLDLSKVGHRKGRGVKSNDFSTTGAMEVFREELEKVRGDFEEGDQASTRPEAEEFQLTLVGHSMGTMVLNEWLRRDQIEQRKKGYANIVYMAAACTVRDFSRSVVPYLVEHPQTQFFNLMLHPLADLRERGRGWDLLPRGSLLVWLDDFLTSPPTPLDRTMGRWDNVISAVEVIPQSIRGQVTLKSFSLAPYNQAPPPAGEPDYGPQEHGQFRGRPYWCGEFWEKESAVVDPKCEMGGN